MPRCCTPLDLSPSYASVLVAGHRLGDAVAAVEAGPLSPCVTAWCPHCYRAALLTAPPLLAQFPSHSAYAAHLLAFHARLEGTLQLDAGP